MKMAVQITGGGGFSKTSDHAFLSSDFVILETISVLRQNSTNPFIAGSPICARSFARASTVLAFAWANFSFGIGACIPGKNLCSVVKAIK